MSSHGRAFLLTYMTGNDMLTDSYSATKNILGDMGNVYEDSQLLNFSLVCLTNTKFFVNLFQSRRGIRMMLPSETSTCEN